ncbi:MAG TPA: NAD(P)-dependent alcohol dehydrogenase, partial [Verrucomicrobiae bacterium]|nr:NAD(P)-dependent alcohol dehydrogenase [Verrucomicrobiae bacterium]
MSAKIKGYAATAQGRKLELIEYDLGDLGDDQVEIQVSHCGICHSDLSMIDNAFGWSEFPLVPGHEVIGTIAAVGAHVKHLKAGQRVGLGWFSGSDMTCPQCLAGDHNLCPKAEQTIVHRKGGFAQRVRCQALWAVPLPAALDSATAGPLFCAGTTVFNPLLQYDVKPTDRAGVIGIGGLGHLALQFLSKWGCEVFAFTSSESKQAEVKKLGAHHAVSSRDPAQMEKLAGSLDFIISTVNVGLNWSDYIKMLAPRGRLHFVGVAPEPLGVMPVELLGQKSISGTPMGSPATIAKMLDFCA